MVCDVSLHICLPDFVLAVSCVCICVCASDHALMRACMRACVQALWLEENSISKIENIHHMRDLRCLFLQTNAIQRIEVSVRLKTLRECRVEQKGECVSNQ